MTRAQLAALIRFKTKTNSTTFNDTDMLPLVNTFKDEIASRIVERNSGYFLIPKIFDLVASSTSREYRFPSNILNRMHKLELKFSSGDARQPSTFIKDYKGSETESEIVANFSNAKGCFAHTIRRGIFILSGTITAVSGGGRLWFHQYPDDLPDLTNSSTDISTDPSTTTFGFPRQFHELLARYVSIEWKGSRPKPIPLNKKELEIEVDMEKALASISHPDNSGEIVADGLSLEDTGNNGFNY